MKLINLMFVVIVTLLVSTNTFATNTDFTYTIVGERASVEKSGTVMKTTPINVVGFLNLMDCNAGIELLKTLSYTGATTPQGTAKSSILAGCVRVTNPAKEVF